MSAPRRATADLPGTGGELKTVPEDFKVEELPLYPASGSGEHLFVTVEKRGLTTLDLVAKLARALDVPRGAIGYAGMKDARAVTVQTVSVPRAAEARLAALALPGVKILGATAHGNKLKLGHSSGNRFEVRVRGVAGGAEAAARAVLERLERRGVPNRFGSQRFGRAGTTEGLGRAVLARDGRALFRATLAGVSGGEAALAAFDRGEIRAARDALPPQERDAGGALDFLLRFEGDAAAALARFDRRLLALYVSALQSAIFNDVLDARLDEFDRVAPGDLAWLHRNGAVFRVEDAVREQPRAETFEISPSGPLPGPRMTAPGGRPAEIEAEALAAHGLAPADFERSPQPGARRPLRVPLGRCRVAADGADLLLAFALPPGAYATVVLDEVMKADPPPPPAR